MIRFRRIIKACIPHRLRPVVKNAALRILYFGNRYYCPVCRSHTRTQRTLGLDLQVIREKQITGAGVRQALCPVCNASDRIRLLYLFLEKKTDLFTGSLKLLHFAPEPPLEKLIKKQKKIRYLTADLNPEGVMEKIDITDIPYPENSFDAILCNHVLEHVPDDSRAMKALYKVLVPGGWTVLQVPVSQVLKTTYENPEVISEDDRERIFGQRDHVRIYGLDYPNRLEKAGFIVQEFRWINDPDQGFHDPKLNLNRDEVVFFCRKVNFL